MYNIYNVYFLSENDDKSFHVAYKTLVLYHLETEFDVIEQSFMP